MPHTLPDAAHFSVSVPTEGDVMRAKAHAFDALVKVGVMNVMRNVQGKDGKTYDIHCGFARKMPARA